MPGGVFRVADHQDVPQGRLDGRRDELALPECFISEISVPPRPVLAEREPLWGKRRIAALFIARKRRKAHRTFRLAKAPPLREQGFDKHESLGKGGGPGEGNLSSDKV